MPRKTLQLSVFLFSRAKKKNATLCGPARSAEGPHRTGNVLQKPIKQQLFPVHHIKVWDITRERNIKRKSSAQWSRRSANPASVGFILHMAKFYTPKAFLSLSQSIFSEITVIVNNTFLEVISIIMLFNLWVGTKNTSVSLWWHSTKQQHSQQCCN